MDFLMVIMASGIARVRTTTTTTTPGVAQDGGHTPNNRLTQTCSLSLLYTSLILDTHFMIS